MAGQTPPDLEQLLTAREREVLDLLRLGLTNAEIGERLDISADGAKWHVSEIIGKLGVRNRREAASWPERPPWWAALVAPLASSWRGVRRALPGKAAPVALAASIALVLALLAGLGVMAYLLVREDGGSRLPAVAASCPTREQPRFDTSDRDLSLDQIGDRIAEAMTCPGYAFHTRSGGDTESGPYSTHSETESWSDPANERNRTETTGRFTSKEAVQEAQESGEPLREYHVVDLRVGDYTYTRQDLIPPDPDSDPVRVDRADGPCARNSAPSLASLCDNPYDEMDLSVEWGLTYRDRPAAAVTRSGTSRGSDETYETTTRTYFDPATYLPLGSTQEGTLDVGTIHPVQSDIPVEFDFVRLDTLPDDFFDPVALGYVEDDPIDDLDALEGPVYWLGREFEGDGAFPAVELDLVLAPLNPMSFQPDVELSYDGTVPEYDWGIVSIKLYRRGRCDGDDAQFVPCSGGHGIVVFDDAIAEISAPSMSNGSRSVRSPYDSPEGMELLIRSLKRRD